MPGFLAMPGATSSFLLLPLKATGTFFQKMSRDRQMWSEGGRAKHVEETEQIFTVDLMEIMGRSHSR